MRINQMLLSCFLLQRTSTSLFPVLLGSLDWQWRLSLPQCIHFSGKVVSISFDYFSKSLICLFLLTDHGGRPNRDWWVETSYGLHSWWRLQWRFQHILNLTSTFFLQHNVQCTLIVGLVTFADDGFSTISNQLLSRGYFFDEGSI